MSTNTAGRRRRKTSKEERVCSVCSQTFKKAEHLARHLRSHTKEKPFQCAVCGRTYAREDTLLRHSRTHQARDESRAMDHPEEEMNSEIFSGQNQINTRASQQITAAESIISTQRQAESGRSRVPPPNLNPNDASMMEVDTDRHNTVHNFVETPPATLFSTDGGEVFENQPSLEPARWDAPLNPGWEAPLDPGWASWLTTGDFDLDAVNLSLLQATSDLVPPMESMPEQSMLQVSEDPNLASGPEPTGRHETRIQRRWHTYSERAPSGYMTPAASQGHKHVPVDEMYRERLADNLQQRMHHGILPSTSFLDLCLQAYFAHFHPIFPVIHASSFRPSTRNSVLLLSICSVGSLFLGSQRATSHGISLFERLHKAILASWETYILQQGSSCIIALQAAVIGQTFGLLAGRPKDLFGIDTFHGSIIVWARKAKLFSLEDTQFNVMNLSDGALSEAWKSWISIEEKKRILLGIHVHDAELAKLHHHEPILRQSIQRLPRLSSNELFAAPSAMHWKTLMIETQIQDTAAAGCPHSQSSERSPPGPGAFAFPDVSSDFELCAMLESISASACEIRHSDASWPDTAQRCRELLTTWYEKYQTGITVHRRHGKAGLMMLWHSIFMILHADMDALEVSCGREGEQETPKALEYAQTWAKSPDATRCVLHAVLIQRHFKSITVGAEPSIHVPMCLYHCGIVWYCYSRFGPGDECMAGTEESLDFPELRLLGINNGKKIITEEIGGDGSGLHQLFLVIDLLQRISHWKIGQSFASTLLALVEEQHDIF